MQRDDPMIRNIPDLATGTHPEPLSRELNGPGDMTLSTMRRSSWKGYGRVLIAILAMALMTFTAVVSAAESFTEADVSGAAVSEDIGDVTLELTDDLVRALGDSPGEAAGIYSFLDVRIERNTDAANATPEGAEAAGSPEIFDLSGGTGVHSTYNGEMLTLDNTMSPASGDVKQMVRLYNPTTTNIEVFLTYRVVIDGSDSVLIGDDSLALEDLAPGRPIEPPAQRSFRHGFDTERFARVSGREEVSGPDDALCADSVEFRQGGEKRLSFDWSDLMLSEFGTYEPCSSIGTEGDSVHISVSVEASLSPGKSTYLDPIYELGTDPDSVIYGAMGEIGTGTDMAHGDLNGDGYEDLLMGAPAASSFDESSTNAGQIFIVFGSSQSLFDPHIDLASDADVTIYGADTDDMLGTSIACGDVDGDGKDDVICGIANGDGSDNGRRSSGEVVVIWGGGVDSMGSRIDLSVSGDMIIYGSDKGDLLGSSVDTGDINNDGYDDVITGAISGDGPTNTDIGCGEVYVIYGNARGALPGTLDLKTTTSGTSVIYGSASGQLLGSAVLIGDLDNDTYGDMIVASRDHDSGRGVVFVIFGSSSPAASYSVAFADVSLTGRHTDDMAGTALTCGDMDGDGFRDLVVGAPYADGPMDLEPRCGEVYVIFGGPQASWPPSVPLSSADITCYGQDANDRVGEDLDSGNMDMDGFDDIIIGAPHVDASFNTRDEAGESYVVKGNTRANMGTSVDLANDANVTIYGENDDDLSGTSVALADIDGDTRDDMAIGHPGSTTRFGGEDNAGGASIFFSGASVDVMIYGAEAGDHSGYSLATGDIDNDGIDDLLIGAPYTDKASGYAPEDVGDVYIIYGASRASLNSTYDLRDQADVVIHGSNGRFGTSVATGDVNNDGYDDILVGMPRWYGGPYQVAITDDDRSYAGGFALFLGNTRANLGSSVPFSSAVLTILGNKSTESGIACALADLNNDGYADLILGTHRNNGDEGGRYHSGEVDIYFGSNSLPTRGDLAQHPYHWYGYPTLPIASPPDVRIFGPDIRYEVGRSLAVGKIDSDNYYDILIGAPFAKASSFSRCGAVFAFRGRAAFNAKYDLSTDSDLTLQGGLPYDMAGSAVTLGDVDNDGHDDIIIGAPGGDGPLNNRKDCGEVSVIYGSDTLLDGSKKVLTESQVDLMLYGSSENENAGKAIVTGDVNNDGYDDIFVGSPYYDDLDHEINDIGQVSIIHGGERAALGSARDLGSAIKYHGSESYDNFGYALSSGNLDNDAYTDVMIGAELASGPRNERLGCGETYVAYGTNATIDLGSIDSLKLTNGGSTVSTRAYDERVCFADKQYYKFQVNVTDVVGLDDINAVSIHLDPSDLNITYRWVRSTGLIYEESGTDPQNYTEILTTGSDVIDDLIDSYRIEFNIMFHSNFPKEKLLSIRVKLETTVAGSDSTTFSNMFRVENDLNLMGEVRVYDESMVLLHDGDWVRGGERLTWTNMSVVYEDSIVRPNPGVFTIGVRGPDGVWYINSTPGVGMINVWNTVEMNTSQAALFELKILNISGSGEDVSSVNITLKIDTAGPIAPASFTVHADSRYDANTLYDNDPEVFLTWIAINDVGGSGVAAYYGAYNDTTPTEKINNGQPITSNGSGLCQFYLRARDRAGNWGVPAVANITIDTETVYFTDAHPLFDEWSNNTMVHCSVRMIDRGGSGIDTSSVEYKTSLDGPENYYSWTNTDVNGWGENDVTAETDVVLSEGMNNYIKWHALDVAGNGYEESDDIAVKVDTTDPYFTDASPREDAWSKTGDVTCSIVIDDVLSGVNASTVEYRLSSSGTSNYGPWTQTGGNGIGHKSYPSVELVLPTGSGNYIQWRVRDNARNLALSPNYRINVDDAPPVFSRLLPNSTSVSETPTVECVAVIQDIAGSGVDISKVQYAISTYDNWLTIGIGSSGYGEWTAAGVQFQQSGNYQSVICTVVPTFADGDYNYIKWRVMDRAGNGYIISGDVPVRTETQPENFPPVPRIASPGHGTIYFLGDDIRFNGTTSTDKNGDALSFFWYSDMDGPLSSSVTFHSANLTRGTHTITLFVTDSLAGHNVSTSIMIEISDRLPSGGSDGASSDGSGGTDGGTTPNTNDQLTDTPLFNNVFGFDIKDLIIFILALVLVIAVLYYFVAARQRELRQEQKLEGREAQWDDYLVGSESRRKHMSCPACHSDIPAEAEFCPVCGKVFKDEDHDPDARPMDRHPPRPSGLMEKESPRDVRSEEELDDGFNDLEDDMFEDDDLDDDTFDDDDTFEDDDAFDDDDTFEDDDAFDDNDAFDDKDLEDDDTFEDDDAFNDKALEDDDTFEDDDAFDDNDAFDDKALEDDDTFEDNDAFDDKDLEDDDTLDTDRDPVEADWEDDTDGEPEEYMDPDDTGGTPT